MVYDYTLRACTILMNALISPAQVFNHTTNGFVYLVYGGLRIVHVLIANVKITFFIINGTLCVRVKSTCCFC